MLQKSKSKLASVIIPNWNGEEFLSVCLPSLKRQTYKNLEIIVVDNGSQDNSVDLIEKKFPEINLVKLSKNTGFANAVNVGIENSKGEFIILINNDTEVDKNCIKYLVEASFKKDVGMVAAKMLNFYNRKIIDSAGDYIDASGHANNIGMGEKDGEKFNKGSYVFLVTGGGGLFKREIFKKIGYFDRDYFAYFEDVDLCLRAQMVGFKGYYEPRAKIYHIHKATSSRNKGLTEYWQFRNMTQTIIKDFPRELFLKDFNWLKIILVNLNTVFYLGRSGYLWSALKAEAFILINLFKLLKKRKKIQKSMSVSPEYILENILPKRISFFKLTRGI